MSSLPAASARRDEESSSVISAILERIPELLTIREVLRRDGTTVEFKADRLGASIAAALEGAGIHDDVLLARCTHQALTRLHEAFGTEGVPTTDDIARVVAATFLDRGLTRSARRALEGTPPSTEEQPVARTGGSLAERGRASGVLRTEEDAVAFSAALSSLLARRHAAFGAVAERIMASASAPSGAVHGVAATPGAAMSAEHPDLAAALAGADATLHAVHVTDAFMRAAVGAVQDGVAVNGSPAQSGQERELLALIACSAWEHGGPRLCYDASANRWNTVAYSGRSNASDALAQDVSHGAASLPTAAMHLPAYLQEDGGFAVDAFAHDVGVMVTALEILADQVGHASPAAEAHARDFRPIGLSIAGLGAFLAARGVPYDSEEARNIASATTALLSALAYERSARLAAASGAFRYYRLNERPFLRVIGMHRDHAYAIPPMGVPRRLGEEARRAWDRALELGLEHGFRNAQVSAIAADDAVARALGGVVSGIDPAPGEQVSSLGRLRMMAALQSFVSGGVEAEVRLPHDATVESVQQLFVDAWKLGLKELAVVREEAPEPTSASVRAEVAVGAAEEEAHSVSVPAAESAVASLPAAETTAPVPAATISQTPVGSDASAAPAAVARPAAPATAVQHEPLPDERRSVTHAFTVAGERGTITVGLYNDGRPGEVFIRMGQGGTPVAGLLEVLAATASIALQHGVPHDAVAATFAVARFEPSGATGHAEIREAASVTEYVSRWLLLRFPAVERAEHVAAADVPSAAADVPAAPVAVEAPGGVAAVAVALAPVESTPPEAKTPDVGESASVSSAADAPTAPVLSCQTCGAIMVRRGLDAACLNCGAGE